MIEKSAGRQVELPSRAHSFLQAACPPASHHAVRAVLRDELALHALYTRARTWRSERVRVGEWVAHVVARDETFVYETHTLSLR